MVGLARTAGREGFDTLAYPVLSLSKGQPELGGARPAQERNRERERAFLGSEHKFPAPSACPSGAALRSAAKL